MSGFLLNIIQRFFLHFSIAEMNIAERNNNNASPDKKFYLRSCI